MPAITENRLHLSEIAPQIIQSEIRSMTVECDAVGGVNLAQGVCDTPLPPSVMDAAIQAIRDGYNIYTRLDGVAVLRHHHKHHVVGALVRAFPHPPLLHSPDRLGGAALSHPLK